MAGVTKDCKECGFPIFDEQTRIGLCDECLALDPLDRISGRQQKEKLEQDRREQLADASRRNRELENLRRQLQRQVQQQEENERNEQLVAQNKRLLAEVKELRRRLDASEVDTEEEPEIRSFLRKFDNLEIEGEI